MDHIAVGHDIMLSPEPFERLMKAAAPLEEIDVRRLEAPLPMMTILGKLDESGEKRTLYVRHRRIPYFLIPELEERKVRVKICVYGTDDVRLLVGEGL